MADKFFDAKVMDRLRRHEPVSAAWVQANSNITAEIFAEAGFDAVIIDMEHSPVDMGSLVSMMQAIKGTECIPIVRAPWNDAVWCKRILDAGAYGLHIPYVSTRKEAEEAVKSCRYFPQGYRGIAGSQRALNYSLNKKEYYERANKDIIVMIAIETPEGVENIEEIVQTPGLDGIFIGPADLSTSMGYLADPSRPQVQEAIHRIEKAVLGSDRFLGTVAANAQAAKKLYDKGYSLVYFLSDTTGLAQLASKEVEVFKNTYRDQK